jgi:multiple sugar transport system permease protein
MSHSKRSGNVIIFYVITTVLALFILLPFFWMVSTSLKSRGALMALPIEWIPKEISFEGYKKLFDVFPFGRTVLNSIFVSIVTTIVSLTSALMAAYAFSKLDFKGKNTLFSLYLATMMIPSQVTTIPIFIVLKYMGLLNTYTGLILPSIFNAFGIFMLRQYMNSISNEFIEAAILDGANYYTIFYQIMIPLCMPVIATLGVITFMGAWNDYFWPLIVLSDINKMTLPVALSQLNGQYSTEYNTLMAGSLISMAPILIVYAFAQKYFEAGLQLGGVKG